MAKTSERQDWSAASLSIWSNGLFTNDGTDSTAARELYYRVTGTAFNAVERPTDRGDRYRLVRLGRGPR